MKQFSGIKFTIKIRQGKAKFLNHFILIFKLINARKNLLNILFAKLLICDSVSFYKTCMACYERMH